ncbi:MAG: hypothetical protein IIW17_06785, partial [Clostridia bacterium]|nr:hypothetical protein [Clostridia bacterium]
LLAQKKNGEAPLKVSLETLCEEFVSVLFDTAGAKRTKNAVRKVSRLRARLGALPQAPGRFLKKATQKLSSCGDDLLG